MRPALLLLLALLFAACSTKGQSNFYSVTGTVLTDTFPLIGVLVLTDLDSQGVQTDIDGKFSLLLPPGKHTLIFQYPGFQERRVEVAYAQQVMIELQEYWIKEWFDTRRIELAASYGIPNNLRGGNLAIHTPSIPGGSTLVVGGSYHTSTNTSRQQATVDLLHFIDRRNYDLSLHYDHIRYRQRNGISMTVRAFRGRYGGRRAGIAVGGQRSADVSPDGTNRRGYGPSLSLDYVVGRLLSLRFSTEANVAVGSRNSYHCAVRYGYRRLHAQLRYDSYGGFNVLLLNAGITLGY